MTRRSNRIGVDWQTPDGKTDTFSWQHVEIEVLMDIRKELRELNDLLHCQNVAKAARAIIRAERRMAKLAKLKP